MLSLLLELKLKEEEGSEPPELSISQSLELDDALDPLEELSVGSPCCLDLDFFLDFLAEQGS